MDLRIDRPAVDPMAEATRQGQRLAESRRRNGYRTASEAARAFGIATPSYLAHENGTRQMRPDIAAFYAKKYGTTGQWILFGTEPMADAAKSARQIERDARPAAKAAVEPPGKAPWAKMFDTRRMPDGERTAVEAVNVLLPQRRSIDGYIPEIDVAIVNQAECWLQLSDRPGAQSFAVRDYVRLPLGVIERPRLFAVTLPGNSLFPDMPGGQRVLVDPDDQNTDQDGFFMAMPTESAPSLLTPVLVSQDEYRRTFVYRSKIRRPTLLEEASVTLLGRIVMRLTVVDDDYVRQAMSAMPRREAPET